MWQEIKKNVHTTKEHVHQYSDIVDTGDGETCYYYLVAMSSIPGSSSEMLTQ